MPNPSPPPSDSQFCTSLPKLHRAFDSMILGGLKKCPRYLQLRFIEGWTPNGSKASLAFGILYHRALETLDRALIEGLPPEEALRQTLREALITSLSFESQGDTARTRQTLIRSIVWYADQFAVDALQTVRLPSGKAAVELSFRIALPLESPDGEPYILCGHIDKLASFNSQVYVVDRKHTKYAVDMRYFEQFSPNGQMSGYTLAAQTLLQDRLGGALIDATQVGVGFNRYGRGFASRTDAQLQEFIHSTLHWIKFAEDCARKDHWPMNDTACHHYGGCEFRGICNKDPAVRQLHLEAAFHRENWNPLQNRGD